MDNYSIKLNIECLGQYGGISSTDYIIQTGREYSVSAKTVRQATTSSDQQITIDINNVRPHYNQQCENEGSLILNNESDTNHYITFDVDISNIKHNALNLVKMTAVVDFCR